MKLLIFLACVGFCLLSPATAIMEDAILNFLEELRKRMCHPIDKFGLPPLDPMHFDHKTAAIDNKYIVDFTGSVTNFNLTGLSDFVVNDLRITTVPLRSSKFNLSMPLTAFKSLYTAKGSLAYVLNLAGEGSAETSVENFSVAVSWVLQIGTSLSIRSLKIEFQIGSLFINFENLIEEERVNDFFHALVNEMGIEILNDIWLVEKEIVQKTVQDRINDVLSQYTLGQIIGIIGGGNDEPIFGPNDPPPDCKDNKDSVNN